jgi:nucleotide-binding universal stress UspA family protein
MFTLRGILVPTNHGEPSKAAIQYGVAFARQFDAKLYLLRILSEADYYAAIETERVLETLLPEVVPEAAVRTEIDPDEVARNAALGDLKGLLDADEERDTDAEYLQRPAGSQGAGEAIVACAEELDVELIVMGKHRMGFVEHLLTGSVTEKVIRQAPCPVLIVHYPEHEFVVPKKSEL